MDLHFADKSSLDEILHLFAWISKPLKIDRIGTFLSFAAQNIVRFGKLENKERFEAKLQDLMTLDGIELLKMSRVLGLNSFSNLALLYSYDLASKKVDLSNIKKCYSQMKTIQKGSNQELVPLSEPVGEVFLEPSPCINVSKYPECRVYCDWHEELKNVLPLKTIRSFNR